MKNYRIEFKRSVLKELRSIPQSILRLIQKSIESLGTNPLPEGCQKIRGYDHHYRIRVGRYRIIYAVKTKVRIITIIKVGHRKDVYRSL